MFSASKAVRVFFFNSSLTATLLIWASINFSTPWLLYLIPGFFLFAAVTGFCPGMILARKLVGES